ncbi:MAG: orotidine-5'-phosphate decarboxylase [Candidatus Omnitrophota bacterium]
MKSEIILALDVDAAQKAKKIAARLYPKIKIFKIGLQLFSASGPEMIKYINRKGAAVFLDLKLFDIPNTVANAIRQAVRLRVKMLTLHISGGEAMLKAAVEAAKNEARSLGVKKPLLIGVTVLTSQKASAETVLRMAKAGLACGLDGIVCSAREAAYLRKKIKSRFYIITPGIRPGNACTDDQKRTATVREAVKAGSNFLVIGRPVLKAKNPLLAVKEVLAEIGE